MMTGCLPQRWPVWLKPELVETDGPGIGPFSQSFPITRDGRIALVPTPGHVAGHCSVIVRGDDMTYFLAGDATYSQENLLAGRTDGVTNDPALARETLRKIREFCAMQPTILLPAHDRAVQSGETHGWRCSVKTSWLGTGRSGSAKAP